MRLRFFLFLFVFISSTLSAQYAPGPSRKKIDLTATRLTSSWWRPDRSNEKDMILTFKGKTLSEMTCEVGIPSLQDTFTFQAALKIQDGKMSVFSAEQIDLKQGFVYEDFTTYDYSVYLEFNNGKRFYAQDSKLKAGLPRDFEGYPCLTMGAVQGRLTNNVKFRIGPGTGFDSMMFDKVIWDEYGPDYTIKQMPHIDKHMSVLVLLRTRDKQKISNWNNYWYFVEIDNGIRQFSRGWVFAEFVDMQN